MLANTYSPRSLVTVERLLLVCSLTSVTSTPGSTPPASLIAPRKPPWNPCPNAVPEATTARNAPKRSAARNLIVPLRGFVKGPLQDGFADLRGCGTGLQQASSQKNRPAVGRSIFLYLCVSDRIATWPRPDLDLNQT